MRLVFFFFSGLIGPAMSEQRWLRKMANIHLLDESTKAFVDSWTLHGSVDSDRSRFLE